METALRLRQLPTGIGQAALLRHVQDRPGELAGIGVRKAQAQDSVVL
ncbi:hypothetical protein [Chelativorans sp. YIM 93263]|nr:hypothetical protein [Chelativorans sp. YIM 93263]